MTKTRIKASALEIKWGLGWIPRFKQPIKLWFVVINGRTKASFETEADARAWVNARFIVSVHG